MKTFIKKILIVATLLLGMQLSASAMAEVIVGKGGKVVDTVHGTVTYCPDDATTACAYLTPGASNNQQYVDKLEILGPTGEVLETHVVNVISIGTGNQSITVEDGGIYQGGSILPLQIEQRESSNLKRK